MAKGLPHDVGSSELYTQACVVGLTGATGGTSVLQGSSGVHSPLGHGLFLLGAERQRKIERGQGWGGGISQPTLCPWGPAQCWNPVGTKNRPLSGSNTRPGWTTTSPSDLGQVF